MQRQEPSCQRSSSTLPTTHGADDVPCFAVHSTFRHKKTGEVLRPHGLQWNLPGTSHVTFVSLDSTKAANQLLLDKDDNDKVKQGIVHAYNRWAFARGEDFCTVQDIEKLVAKDPNHLVVEWKDPDARRKRIFHEQYHADVAELLQKDASVVTTKNTSSLGAQVWINGELVGHSNGPDSVVAIRQVLSQVTSRRLAYKRWQSDENSTAIIRIERYFGGYLSKKDEIFDHIMDNLIALEDVQMLDEQTLIGSATLEDWIMGGVLTSRLWVQQQGDRIRFLRPLHNDDIATSDRKFDLMFQTDADKVALVQAELARLRHLATLTHPLETNDGEMDEHKKVEADPLAQVRQRLAQNRPRRKFFGL